MQDKIQNDDGQSQSDILTVDEVASDLNVGPGTVRKLAKAGELPCMELILAALILVAIIMVAIIALLIWR